MRLLDAANVDVLQFSLLVHDTFSIPLHDTVKGLSFLAFVRPVALLHRPLAQLGGWKGPPVAEGGLC